MEWNPLPSCEADCGAMFKLRYRPGCTDWSGSQACHCGQSKCQAKKEGWTGLNSRLCLQAQDHRAIFLPDPLGILHSSHACLKTGVVSEKATRNSSNWNEIPSTPAGPIHQLQDTGNTANHMQPLCTLCGSALTSTDALARISMSAERMLVDAAKGHVCRGQW